MATIRKPFDEAARDTRAGISDVVGLNRGDRLADKLAACMPTVVNLVIRALRDLDGRNDTPDAYHELVSEVVADGEVGPKVRSVLTFLGQFTV